MKQEKIIFGTVLAVLLMLMTPSINANQMTTSEGKTNETDIENNNAFHVLFIYLYKDDTPPGPYIIWVNEKKAPQPLYVWINFLTKRLFAFSVVNTNEVTIKIQGFPEEFTHPFSKEFDLSGYGTLVRFSADANKETIKIVQ